MRRTITVVLAGAVGFAVASLLVSHRLRVQHAGQLAERQAAWYAEKAELETALEQLRNGSRSISTTPQPAPVVQVTNRLSAAEILERLKGLQAGTNSPRSMRVAIQQFENLLELGPGALPAIRAFLAQNVDVVYGPGGRRASRQGRMSSEFGFPPTLRLGLLEVVKDIGGAAGELLLAEVLKSTGQAAEVAYVAYALQEMAPNKYRETALASAHNLLARPALSGPAAASDRLDRESLYGVLSFFNDQSYVTMAQAQMVQPNGAVDALAVRYLQQTLREESVALASQAWQDARIPAEQKEPLARVALTYAGMNEQANQLFQAAINEPALPPGQRRNLIEDLNEAGFADPRHLTQADLPLIQRRIWMIEQLAPNALDQVNAAAFKEAYKDLIKMQNSLVPKAAAPQ